MQAEISGDLWYADRLELAAFNAMPGAFMNGSMWSMMYFQQGNKLDAVDGHAGSCEGGPTYAYGMVYECCVANHMQVQCAHCTPVGTFALIPGRGSVACLFAWADHLRVFFSLPNRTPARSTRMSINLLDDCWHWQGWPKFAQRQFARTQSGGLAILQYFGSTTGDFTLGSKQHGDNGAAATVSANVTTDYPFSGDVTITLRSSAPLEFELRIPGWASDGSTVQVGSASKPEAAANGTMHKVPLPAGLTLITLALPMVPRLEPTGINGSVVVKRGPLVYVAPREIAAIDGKGVYDDGPGLLPKGQPHGRDNYILATDEWRHVIFRNSSIRETPPRKDLPTPPPGQGVFSRSLVPAPTLTVSAATLPASAWGDRTPDGEGQTSFPCGGSTSINGYVHATAASPPVVDGAECAGGMRPLQLVPYGATDVRVAVFPAV